jgi:lysozyme
MMFNLGRPRYSKFRKHIQAVMDGNWQESANQMRDSRWYRQVTNRAERLCKRMEEVKPA